MGVSIKQDVEIKEDSKKPEYGRQMSLGTEIKKMARSNREKENININKTKNVKGVLEENNSLSSEDKCRVASNNETVIQEDEVVMTEGESKNKAPEDIIRENIKDCDDTRIQNVSSESESADLVTNKELKESQEILVESKQQTISSTNETMKSSKLEGDAPNQELRERNVSLNDIIRSKNKDTKGRRKSNVKASGSSKKVSNDRNITLKDVLETKRKSSKASQLDPSIQKSKQQTTQEKKLVKKKVTDRKSTKSLDNILTCNTSLKSEAPLTGKDVHLDSKLKSKSITVQKKKARKRSTDTQEKTSEKMPWVGPLDINPSCRKYSTGKNLSIDKDSRISSTEINSTNSEGTFSVDEKCVKQKRTTSSETQNRKKRRETIDSTNLSERTRWVGPL